VLNLSGWRERGFYGRAHRNKADITAEDLRRRLHITLDHEVEVLEHQFARNNVSWVSGDARFLDRTPSRSRRTRRCAPLPRRPHHPRRRHHALSAGAYPFDGESVVDADEISNLKRLPRSLAVIGASVIGIEYATIFSALDVKLTVIEPGPALLGFVDRELVDEFIHDLRDRGVSPAVQQQAVSVEKLGPEELLGAA
jgi:NAD(P) transhydrogenase